MNVLEKIKIWLSLRKAKQQEQKHLITEDELLKRTKDFVQEEKLLNNLLKQKKRKREKDNKKVKRK